MQYRQSGNSWSSSSCQCFDDRKQMNIYRRMICVGEPFFFKFVVGLCLTDLFATLKQIKLVEIPNKLPNMNNVLCSLVKGTL